MAVPAGTMAWLRPGTPLLPSVVRHALRRRTLPPALAKLLGLRGSSHSVAALSPKFWNGRRHPLPPAAGAALAAFVAPLPSNLLEAKALPEPLRADLRLSGLPFRRRTRKIAEAEGWLEDPARLQSLTIGQMLALPNFGILSLLDLLAVVEAAAAAPVRRRNSAPKRGPHHGPPEAIRLDVPAWGQPGSPQIPAVLREAWAALPLPPALRRLAPLRASVTFRDLPPTFALRSNAGREVEVLVACCGRLVRPAGILRAFPGGLPADLPLARLPFRNRTHNILERTGWLRRPAEFGELRIQDLLAIRGMGLVSLLDLLCVIEAWVAPLDRGSVQGEPLTDPWDRLQAVEHLEDLGEALTDELLGREKAMRDAVNARLGWLGQPPITLREAGQRIGVTRERIRQLEKVVKTAAARGTWRLPLLERAVRILTEASPLAASRGAELLRSSGCARRAFHPASLLSLAQVFGCRSDLVIEVFRGHEVVIERRRADDYREALEIAASRCDSLGAIPAALLPGLLRAQRLADAPLLAERLLRSSDLFVPLRDDWHALVEPTRVSTVAHFARKMVYASGGVDLPQIEAGVQRVFAHRRATGRDTFHDEDTPPLPVLAAILGRDPALRAGARGLVEPAGNLRLEKLLSRSELALVRALRRAPDFILDRRALWEVAERSGVGKYSFDIYLSYNPLFVRIAPMLYSLCCEGVARRGRWETVGEPWPETK